MSSDDQTKSLPRSASIVARALEVLCLLTVIAWVRALGGVSLHPEQLDASTNDTSKLFNVHPILQVTAFAVLMAEALQAWRHPLLPDLQRYKRKMLHASLQSAALLTMYAGAVFAYLSHSLKRPVPTPNLYSTHSWLGALTLTLATAQFAAGLAFVTGVSLHKRQQLAPWHVWLGRATFLVGLATILVGVQEKTTFAQIFSKLPVRSAAMQLPVFLNLLVVALAIAVMLSQTSVKTKSPAEDGLLADAALED